MKAINNSLPNSLNFEGHTRIDGVFCSYNGIEDNEIQRYGGGQEHIFFSSRFVHRHRINVYRIRWRSTQKIGQDFGNQRTTTKCTFKKTSSAAQKVSLTSYEFIKSMFFFSSISIRIRVSTLTWEHFCGGPVLRVNMTQVRDEASKILLLGIKVSVSSQQRILMRKKLLKIRVNTSVSFKRI